MKLKYVIKFVADMDRVVKFYREVLGLPLKFQSPDWSEFVTGETILALRPAPQKNLAGAVDYPGTFFPERSVHRTRYEYAFHALPDVDSHSAWYKRLAGSLPVGAGRHSHDGSEHLAEITLAAEADELADFRDGDFVIQ